MHLPGTGRPQIGEDAIRVAILGRPNVGKSSLLNALVGQERVIVSDVPGTTRDAIDTVLERGETTFVLVDTAGMRRKRRQRQGIEYYSELRALEAAERADIALVLVDVSEGVVDQDLAVADVARKAMCGTIVVLAKWDVGIVGIEDVRPRLEARLRQRPPLIAVSAKTGRGVERLLDLIEKQFVKYEARVSTGELNRFLKELREDRQPPQRAGRRLNLLYGTQTARRPPRFRFFVNDPSLVTRDYALLGREPPARALRPRRRPRLDRLRPARMKVAVVGAGSWGTAFSRLLLERGHEVTLVCRDAEQARAIAETGHNPRYLPQVDLRGIVPGTVPGTRLEETNLFVLALPSKAFADVARALPGDAPVLSLTKGLDPATGARLSTLVAAAAGRRPLRPEPRGGDRARPAGGRRHRVRGRGARRGAPAGDQLARLPHLRQSRRRRRRALRRRQERDRARGRRRRRPRPRRQRQGGADHARPRRDGKARRGVRRASRDVRRPRGHGRPDRHVRGATRTQPHRRRADRTRSDARAKPSRRSVRPSRGSRRRRCCATSRAASASRCRSRKASARCSKATCSSPTSRKGSWAEGRRASERSR